MQTDIKVDLVYGISWLIPLFILKTSWPLFSFSWSCILRITIKLKYLFLLSLCRSTLGSCALRIWLWRWGSEKLLAKSITSRSNISWLHARSRDSCQSFGLMWSLDISSEWRVAKSFLPIALSSISKALQVRSVSWHLVHLMIQLV